MRRLNLHVNALVTQREARGSVGLALERGDKTWAAGVEAASYDGAIVPGIYFGIGAGRAEQNR